MEILTLLLDDLILKKPVDLRRKGGVVLFVLRVDRMKTGVKSKARQGTEKENKPHSYRDSALEGTALVFQGVESGPHSQSWKEPRTTQSNSSILEKKTGAVESWVAWDQSFLNSESPVISAIGLSFLEDQMEDRQGFWLGLE